MRGLLCWSVLVALAWTRRTRLCIGCGPTCLSQCRTPHEARLRLRLEVWRDNGRNMACARDDHLRRGSYAYGNGQPRGTSKSAPEQVSGVCSGVLVQITRKLLV